ncbi:probable BOI-related E3 ubiquitin-protein ligase 3 [Phalaenopsis equestris]|uniref:probable BOI-related E3 ubiquitin-protein ligase 3 n=1 Tax=Phalaenopsis equestris TaxID=78828 RepID=UPI0009E56029|nr:probable BOI-related E3 ubiquitin-protein ligase 3 [Phalaenopsis equestris]
MNGSCGAVNTALMAPSDKSTRVFDSASACTSGRPTNVPIQSAPAPLSFGQEILAQIYHQNSEMDALIRLQNERIRLGAEEVRKRHCRSLFSNLKQIVVKRFQEKEIELEEANRKNAELEEKIQQVNAESQLWFNVAKNNEVLVSNLRTNLEQVLLQNAATAAAVTPLTEGYGDSDGIAGDAESFCFDDDTRMAAAALPTCMPSTAKKTTLQQMNCKVCGVVEVSVLVLPCRHLCLCQNCESSVAICPLCNYPKNASLQVFM